MPVPAATPDISALLAALEPVSLVAGSTALFALAATWFVLGTVLVSRVRGAR